MIEQHYTADEVAERLKVSTDTVFRAAARRELRSVVIGRSRRFPESAIVEWLERSQERRVDASVIPIARRA